MTARTGGPRNPRRPRDRSTRSDDPLVERVRAGLARTTPRTIEPERGDRQAAVSLILRAEPGPAILFVARAIADGDPWSGDAALPGGHVDRGDADILETARREVREEVGVDLPREAFLGRLDDVRPMSRSPSIVVSAFVAWVAEDPSIVINHEVERHVWVPVRALGDPGRRTEVVLERREATRRFDAIEFDDLTVWGLTHRVVTNFLAVASHDILELDRPRHPRHGAST